VKPQGFRTRVQDERGSLALELVVLTPVLVLTLWIVGALTLRAMVAHAQVDDAARDAARVASIARSVPAAKQVAAAAAASSLQRARGPARPSTSPATPSGSSPVGRSR